LKLNEFWTSESLAPNLKTNFTGKFGKEGESVELIWIGTLFEVLKDVGS